MNIAVGMKKSTKCIGKYEAPLINRICQHFDSLGFKTFPHVRFNIAWGSSLSDIDVIAMRNNVVTAVEIKSRKDKISRATSQLNAMLDYVDYTYLATDRPLRNWQHSKSGVLLVEQNEIRVVRRASKITNEPRLESLFALPKKCLLRLLGVTQDSKLLKYDIAERILAVFDDETLRQCMKEIVLCQDCNENECPIINLVSEFS